MSDNAKSLRAKADWANEHVVRLMSDLRDLERDLEAARREANDAERAALRAEITEGLS